MIKQKLDLHHLSEAFDEVKRQCPELAVSAILWLHVLHPLHPFQADWLKNGFPMADGKRENRLKRILMRLVREGKFLLSLFYAVVFTLRLSRLKTRLRPAIRDLLAQPFEWVAKSWWFESDLGSGKRDFYYGDLQDQLFERGVRMLILSGNHTGMTRTTLRKMQASISCPWQLPEFCLVPFWAPLQFAFLQRRAATQLAWLAREAQQPLVRAVAHRASLECLSRENISIGLYHWIGRSIVKHWKPRAFVTLYEGYAWEKLLLRGIKSIDPTCKTMGYQHTILLQHNLALLKPEQRELASFKPDVVLCLGPKTLSMLRSSHSNSTLVPFGTFRRSNLPSSRKPPSPGKRTVLVLPEGYPEEIKLLFDQALRVASQLPEYRFILRPHPFAPFDPTAFFDEGTPQNVQLSHHTSIEQDFNSSSVALYRGSSAALYAVLHGLKPIYLSDDQAPEVDPLFELSNWRERAESSEELVALLRRYADTDPTQAQEAWQPAAEYIHSYTVAADGTSIDRLLGTLERPLKTPAWASDRQEVQTA